MTSQQAHRHKLVEIQETMSLPQGLSASDNVTRAGETALYYGFTPIVPIKVTKEHRDAVEKLSHNKKNKKGLVEKVALLSLFESIGGGHPLMLFSDYREAKTKESFMTLNIVGAGKPIADALIIRASLSILAEEGFTDLCVDINSTGDKDSFQRFNRELGNYYKKHTEELHPSCRQASKQNPLSVLFCNHDACISINEKAPTSIGCLSENSRNHLTELLEYLETSDIPYNINTCLFHNNDYCSHSVFVIHGKSSSEQEERTILCRGIRYNALGKKIGLKKDIPAVGAEFIFEKTKIPTIEKSLSRIKAPRFFFIQMGNDAKLKSLLVLEELRKARIRVFHTLTRDKLVSQMNLAEQMKMPYILLIGQKESIDNTVIVRDMDDRSQEAIPLSSISVYLKKIDRNR